MPLAAIVDGELQISSLLSAEDWAQLKADATAKRVSVEMRCGWRGFARTSKLGTQHFVHSAGGDSCTARETQQHLLAKARIVDGIVAAGWTPEPEAQGEGWVADVLASKDGRRVVFEVQWSPQAIADYRFRQERYLAAGIDEVIWFARQVDGMPFADSGLPVFPFARDDVAEVRVDGRRVALGEVVEQVLRGSLGHRDFSDGARRATASLAVIRVSCHACQARFVAWSVRELSGTGSCGTFDELEAEDFPAYRMRRYEQLPAIVEAVRPVAAAYRLPLGELDRRFSKAAGMYYLAFCCPSCKVVSGEGHLQPMFEMRARLDTVDLELPATPLLSPHWCRDSGHGQCGVPKEVWRLALLSDPSRDRTYLLLGRGRKLAVRERVPHRGRGHYLTRVLDKVIAD